MIRLDTYPEAQIAMHMNPGSTTSTTPMLCCLLHTGPLPASHQVQVWVGGAQQIGEQEGMQQVFSWQCAQGSEMSVHLMQQHRPTKIWRGWWQGETTLVHTGTLAIQVFCAGVPQPARRTPPPAPVPAPVTPGVPDQHNGLYPQAVPAALTLPPLLDLPAPSLAPINAEPEDDLWSNPPQEEHPGAAETIEEEVSGNDTDQNLLEEEEESWEDGALEEEETEDTEDENQENAGLEGEHGGPGEVQHGTTDGGVFPETTDVSTVLPQTCAPAGTMIATLPANPVWSQTAHQEAEARLATLLATMPPHTILVDLRQHSSAPRTRRMATKSGPQKQGLSKELLRMRYGGRYWDRGSVIQTSRRLESTRPARWRRVVMNPDDREGLGALVTALGQGFSLLVLDGEPSYAESARAAVLLELRQRVANLREGSCS